MNIQSTNWLAWCGFGGRPHVTFFLCWISQLSFCSRMKSNESLPTHFIRKFIHIVISLQHYTFLYYGKACDIIPDDNLLNSFSVLSYSILLTSVFFVSLQTRFWNSIVLFIFLTFLQGSFFYSISFLALYHEFQRLFTIKELQSSNAWWPSILHPKLWNRFEFAKIDWKSSFHELLRRPWSLQKTCHTLMTRRRCCTGV